jgi:hypothetical protein
MNNFIVEHLGQDSDMGAIVWQDLVKLFFSFIFLEQAKNTNSLWTRLAKQSTGDRFAIQL